MANLVAKGPHLFFSSNGVLDPHKKKIDAQQYTKTAEKRNEHFLFPLHFTPRSSA